MRDNPIQFAVVREDPELEMALLEPMLERSSDSVDALMIASGGCTALSLAARYPSVSLTLFDPNPAQLDLVERKRVALENPALGDSDRARFNVANTDATGLNACGNFESLFRGLSAFLFELVVPEVELRRLFAQETAQADRGTIVDRILSNRYWPVAFEMFFADPLLEAMFGPDAVQHAEPGSYPEYFQRLFERGLRADGARDNYFLHHALLGCYFDRPRSLPPYLAIEKPLPAFELVEGYLEDVPELERFDLVSLSNITDWMPVDEVGRIAERLASKLHPGASVLLRQLNNELDLAAVFGSSFRFDPGLGRELLGRDRSLFYCAVHVAERV